MPRDTDSPFLSDTSRQPEPNLMTPLFWDTLDKDIEQISCRAKKKLKKYQEARNSFDHASINVPSRTLPQKKTIHPLQTSNPEQLIDFTNVGLERQSLELKGLNRCDLQGRTRREKMVEMAITNRIRFIEHQKNRDSKTIQNARRNYERIVQIRQISFQEKQRNKKRLEFIQKEKESYSRKKAMQIRSERSKTSLAMGRLKSILSLEAEQIRKNTLRNESSIEVIKEGDLHEKQQRVEEIKNSLEKSKSKLNDLSEEKKRRGRIEHNNRMLREHQTAMLQQKRNQMLMTQLRKTFYAAVEEKETQREDRKAELFPKRKNTSFSFYLTANN